MQGMHVPAHPECVEETSGSHWLIWLIRARGAAGTFEWRAQDRNKLTGDRSGRSGGASAAEPSTLCAGVGTRRLGGWGTQEAQGRVAQGAWWLGQHKVAGKHGSGLRRPGRGRVSGPWLQATYAAPPDTAVSVHRPPYVCRRCSYRSCDMPPRCQQFPYHRYLLTVNHARLHAAVPLLYARCARAASRTVSQTWFVPHSSPETM